MNASKTTIIVPTYERTAFINRFVLSLQEMNFGGTFILSDASSEEGFKRTQQLLKKIEPSYKIKHVWVPKAQGMSISLSLNHCIATGAKLAETPYSMLTCDDDIPVPKTLEKCQQQLEQNPSFASAIGDYVLFNLGENLNCTAEEALAKNKPVLTYETAHLAQSSASERFTFYLENFFHTMFFMTRTEHIKDVVPDCAYKMSFPLFSADYLWMFTLALAGPCAYVEAPFVIRQRHDQNLGPTKPYPSMVDGMMASSWGSDCTQLIHFIRDKLMEKDGLSEEKATSLAKKGFSTLVSGCLRGDIQVGLQTSEFFKLRRRAYNREGNDEVIEYEYAIRAILGNQVNA